MPEKLELNAIKKLAIEAGQLLKSGIGSAFKIDHKEGRHNLVTEYDTKSEKLIIETLKRNFPDHSFLAEEGGKQGTKSPDKIQWIIDPLDGTVNFAHNIPFFSVSIAATRNDEVLLGVIYDPMRDELFAAEKNQGATLNDHPLKVTDQRHLQDCIAITGFPYNAHENFRHCQDLFIHFVKMGIPVRRLGSAALDLCYLAAGRSDFFWEVSLQPWDFAAAKLIVEEAGGTFTDFEGKAYTHFHEGPILASNGHLHDELLHNIRQI